MTKLVEIDLNPDTKTLRNFGVIAFFGFGVLSVLAHTEKLMFASGLGDARVSVVVGFAAIGTCAGLVAAVAPSANRPLYVGLSYLSFPIGFVVSHAVMALLFFGVIGPVAIAFRLVGRDFLDRRYDAGAESYWRSVARHRDKESYFNQY